MEVTSMRWPTGTKKKLMRLAHMESLRTSCQVTWSQLVRQTVEKHLLADAPPQCSARAPVAQASRVSPAQGCARRGRNGATAVTEQ
jgi:hypothetical protein